MKTMKQLLKQFNERSVWFLALLMALPVVPVVAVAEEDDEEFLEEVIVTGSRIRTSELTSVKPVEVITAETINSTGLNNIGDVLQNITSSDGTGIRPVTTSTNGGDGSNEVSLRNLGAGRTLVLVDGRRWVTDAYGTVDMQTIPQAMIQRVEILKDGASSIYGSDAIAGVINFITKKNFDGFDMRLSSGQFEAGDGEQELVSLSWGSSGERGSTVFNVSYASQGAVFAGDRKISSVPYWGCKNYPGSGTPPNSFICGSSYPEYGRYFDLGLTLTPGKAGSSPDDFEPWNNGARYNYAPINYLQMPLDRWSAYVRSDYEFTDNLAAYAQFIYTKRKSVQQIAEVPLTVGVSGPQWDIVTSADNVFNPFGQDLYAFGLRSRAVGPRIYDYDYDVYGLRMGLEGSFDVGDSTFYYSAGWHHNDAAYDSKLYNFINLFNLANAVGPSFRDAGGALNCGTPDNVIRGCVPFNIFGGPDLGLGAGVISQAEYDSMVDYVSYDGVQGAGYKSDDYWIDLSGSLFALPAGDVMFAVGFEKRSNSYFDQPDTLIASGGSSSNYREPTRGATTVEEYFAELRVPIAADVTMFQELELTVSGRKSDYSAKGRLGLTALTNDPGSPSTYEIGLKWRPINDLMIRFTMGETFRAPSIGNLYSGGGEGFPQANDPCNEQLFATQSETVQARCLADGVPAGGALQPTTQLRSLGGGNPFLEPEEGENWTAGLVYTPSYLDGLSVIVDFWSVELTNVLSGIGAQSVLNRCYLDGSSQDSAFCAFVERDASGKVQTVRTSSINSAVNNVEGVDLGIRYDFETANWGTFILSADGTYYTKDEFAQTADSPVSESFGWYDGAADWRWRANATVQWMYNEKLNVTWNMRFLDDMKDDCWISTYYISDAPCSNPTETNNFGYEGTEHIDQTTYHDLQVSYNINDNLNIFVGGRNIFGTEPPKVFDSFSHGFDMAWDMPEGGYFYGGINYSL
jgi:iron complex outermembrane receptor protein